MSEHVSAFAARKVVRPTPPEAVPETHLPEPRSTIVQDDLGSRHPRKRRKKAGSGEVLPQKEEISDSAKPPDPKPVPTDPSQPSSELIHEIQSDVQSISSENNASSHTVVPPKSRELSTFRPSPSNVIIDDEREWCVRLSRRDTVALVGQYDLWVKKGAISVYGAVIVASSKLYRIHAPTTHGIPVVKPVIDPFSSEKQTCEVTFRSCYNGIRPLQNLSPKFKHIWNSSSGRNRKHANPVVRWNRSFAFLQSSNDDPLDRSITPLDPPHDWNSSLQFSMSPDVRPYSKTYLVCGPKGTGKSTLCRFLLNHLLSCTQRQKESTKTFEFFIDLDPGQPEYSAPGQISLMQIPSFNLGVPFTHSTSDNTEASRIIRSHFLGALSPRDDPEHYMRCAKDLVQSCRRVSQSDPALTVINCPGWIQGTGLEILEELIQNTPVTDVIYTSTAGPEEVVGVLSKACRKVNAFLHQITSSSSQEVTRSASDLRTMQTMSYLHLAEPEGGNLYWDSQPLNYRTPMKLAFAGPKQAIFAVLILGGEQHPNHFPDILDGSILGLVVVDDDRAFAPHDKTSHVPISDDHIEKLPVGPSNEQRDTTPTYPDTAVRSTETPQYATPLRSRHDIPYLPATNRSTRPLAPEYSSCIGQAFIQSIDLESESKCFNLITPVPPSELVHHSRSGKKLVLVRGNLDTPAWAYKEEFEYLRSRRTKPKKTKGDNPGVEIDRERDHGGANEKEKGEEEEEGRVEGDEDEDVDEDEVLRGWVQRQPWLSVSEIGTKRAKARKIRKDIRYRPQGGDGT